MDQQYSQFSREDFYSQIYHHEEIYPPPSEHDSVFLEIMSGCRYGKCLFCDFRRDKLAIYGLEDIERQLGLLRVIEDERNRMHFLGCNPFFFSTEILLEEREMVSRLNMTRECRFIDSTVMQKYTISATLPIGKAGLIRAIDKIINQEIEAIE